MRRFWQCYLKVKWTRNKELFRHFDSLFATKWNIFLRHRRCLPFLTLQYSIYSLITFEYKSVLFEIQYSNKLNLVYITCKKRKMIDKNCNQNTQFRHIAKKWLKVTEHPASSCSFWVKSDTVLTKGGHFMIRTRILPLGLLQP